MKKRLEQAKGRVGAGADIQFSKTTRVGSTGRETCRKPERGNGGSQAIWWRKKSSGKRH